MAREELFFVETTYRIHYQTGTPVPIDDVIESLRSIERLIKRTPKFVEAAYKGVQVVGVDVYVDSLQTGSLIEEFMVRFVFKGKENYDNAKEVVAKLVEDNDVIRTVVAVGVGGLITAGAMSALGSKAPSTHVEAYNNTIITIGGVADMGAGDIKKILEGITDKKTLAKEAIGAIVPAKTDPDATIEFAGFNALTMGTELLRELPDEYVPPVQDEDSQDYADVDLVVYASDRDKTTSAWAGLVPGIVDKRVPFSLGEDVDPTKLHGRTRVRADITVISKFNKKKKSFEPKKVEIRKTNM